MIRSVFFAFVFLLGCSIDGGMNGPASEPSAATRWISDGGTRCARPDEGCPCEIGDLPHDCYLEPTYGPDDVLTCHRGTRACQSGEWTACVGVESYEIRHLAGTAALRAGPTECNPCEPGCGEFTDIPDADDLPGNSDDVEYDPSAGGIVLESDGIALPMLADSDGDGVPDDADECVGEGAFIAADGSCFGGDFFFHTLPFGGPTEISPLEFAVAVRTADVYFLMDTTGSMGGEIATLQRSLTSGSYISGCSGGIIGAIRCTIPDAWFGVGQYDDYPVSPYGSSGCGDVVYRNLQNITPDINQARNAVNNLRRHCGSDGPESQSQALWAVATGNGLGPFLSPQTGCSADEWGYPCFRDGTIPIVIHFTDAPFHNGPSGYNYSLSSGGSGGGATLPPTIAVSGNTSFGAAFNVPGNADSSWTGYTGNSCTGVFNASFRATCASNRSDQVFFRFTVASRRQITISLDGSSYDTMLSLRNSSGGQIACNDDAIGLRSRIIRTLNPGTYYAVVSGYSTRCGNYRLSIGNPSSASAPPTGTFPVSWTQSVNELNRQSVRVITVHSGGSYGRSDVNALADATSSYTSSGARAVFPISGSGRGLDRTVVNAVVDLANYSRMDVSARATDDPSTTAVDERGFVASVEALGWSVGSCRAIVGGSRFSQCLPGSQLDFRFNFRNDFVPPTTTNQVFNFFIEVLGDDVYVLQRIPVRIIVPANVPTYPAEGHYQRDYDSTAFCTPTESPDWRNLTWNVVSMPAGTSVLWEIRSAETAAGLDTATPIRLNVPGTSPPVDIGMLLNDSGLFNRMAFLRVRATLRANADRTSSPVLNSFNVTFGCSPFS